MEAALKFINKFAKQTIAECNSSKKNIVVDLYELFHDEIRCNYGKNLDWCYLAWKLSEIFVVYNLNNADKNLNYGIEIDMWNSEGFTEDIFLDEDYDVDELWNDDFSMIIALEDSSDDEYD